MVEPDARTAERKPMIAAGVLRRGMLHGMNRA
jgi:hypothetical protein